MIHSGNYMNSLSNFVFTSLATLSLSDSSSALMTVSHVFTPHFKNVRYNAILQDFTPFPSLLTFISWRNIHKIFRDIANIHIA